MRDPQIVIRAAGRIPQRHLRQQQLGRTLGVLRVAAQQQRDRLRVRRIRHRRGTFEAVAPRGHLVRQQQQPVLQRLDTRDLLRVLGTCLTVRNSLDAVHDRLQRVRELRLSLRIRHHLVVQLKPGVRQLHHLSRATPAKPIQVERGAELTQLCLNRPRRIQRLLEPHILPRLQPGYLGRLQDLGQRLDLQFVHPHQRGDRPLHHVVIYLTVVSLRHLVPALSRRVECLLLLVLNFLERGHNRGQLRLTGHHLPHLGCGELLRQPRQQRLRRILQHQPIRLLLWRHLAPEVVRHGVTAVAHLVQRLSPGNPAILSRRQVEPRAQRHARAHRRPVRVRQRHILERGPVLVRDRLQHRLNRFLRAFPETVDQRHPQLRLRLHDPLRGLVQVISRQRAAAVTRLLHQRSCAAHGEHHEL